MKSILTQLHAIPEELMDFAASLNEEFGLVITMVMFRPFKLKVIEGKLTHDDFLLD